MLTLRIYQEYALPTRKILITYWIASKPHTREDNINPTSLFRILGRYHNSSNYKEKIGNTAAVAKNSKTPTTVFEIEA